MTRKARTVLRPSDPTQLLLPLIPLIQCTQCTKHKPRKQFYTSCLHKGGDTGVCKECFHAKQRQYRRTHKDKVMGQRQRYRARYFDRTGHWPVSTWIKTEDARKRYRSQERERRRNNPEVRAKLNAQRAARRARDKGATVIELVYLDVLYIRDKGICQICGEPCMREVATSDHMIALCNGGEHSYANCRLAHSLCNSQKLAEDLATKRHTATP